MTINLSPRSESVLKTLIEAYLVQGEPVGSRLLSKLLPAMVAVMLTIMATIVVTAWTRTTNAIPPPSPIEPA